MTDFYEDRNQEDWLANVTEDMILAGQERTKAWSTIWSSGLNQVYNNQRSGIKADDNDVDIQINQSWPAMMQETALQAQRRPMIKVEPHDEEQSDEDAAKFWEGHLQHRWVTDLDMGAINEAASLDAFCYGLYIAKVYWEPKAEWDEKNRRWVGRPIVNLMFPPYFGADPEAEKIDMSTSYIYTGRRVSVDWMLQRWGWNANDTKNEEMTRMILDAAGEDPYNSDFTREMGSDQGPVIQPHGTSETQMASSFQREDGSDLESISNRGRLVNLINQARGFGSSNDVRNVKGRPRHLTLQEIYFRDLTEGQKTDAQTIPMEELAAQGSIEKRDDEMWVVANPEAFKKSAPHLKEGMVPSSGDMPTRTNEWMEPTFPRGRIVLKIGKDKILNPKESEQVYPYKRWPVVTGVFHALPHLWQGLNGTEMSEGPQYWLNACYTQLLNWINYHGNPQKEVDPSKLAHPEQKVTGHAGGTIEVAPNQLGKAVANLEPAKLSPGIPAIVQMVERHMQGIGGKNDQALGRESVGSKETATAIAAKQQSELVRTTLQIQHRDNWNMEVMDLVKEMDQANLEPGDWVKLAGKDFMSRSAEVTAALLNLEFAIKLEIGTSLPFDREKKKQDMERLAAILGAIPMAERLLEAFEVDKPEEILERIEGYQQFMAFLEQKRQEQEQAEQEQRQPAQVAG